jgi:DNA-binding IclR family transcriptional regulator
VYYALEEKDNQVSISEIAARTEDFLSLKQARSLVEKLVDCGFLKVIGKGRNTRYSFGM